MKLNLTNTDTNSNFRAHSIDPYVAPAPSWYPFCWLHPPRPPAMREAGEWSGIPQAYVLHDTTPQQHTHTEGAGRGGPYPHSTPRHTQSQQHTHTHRLENTLTQGRT